MPLDLPMKCANESARREYFAQGREYRMLDEAIRNSPNKSFFDPELSVRYRDTEQLSALDLIVDLAPEPGPSSP